MYQSALHMCDIYQELFDDLYARVLDDFETLKEKGLSSEEGKAIIKKWTN